MTQESFKEEYFCPLRLMEGIHVCCPMCPILNMPLVRPRAQTRLCHRMFLALFYSAYWGGEFWIWEFKFWSVWELTLWERDCHFKAWILESNQGGRSKHPSVEPVEIRQGWHGRSPRVDEAYTSSEISGVN